MYFKDIETSEKQKHKGVIFVCRYCGNLYWTYKERDEHVKECINQNKSK